MNHIAALHGATTSADEWVDVREELARRDWSLWAPDLPGHRRNAHLVNGLGTVTDLAGWVVARLGAHDRCPAGIFGHSLGGAVAVHVAERLRLPLIVSEPPCQPTRSLRGLGITLHLNAAAARNDADSFAAALRAKHPRWSERGLAAIIEGARTCDVEAVVGQAASVGGQTTALLAAARVPVLLLVAADQTFTTVDTAVRAELARLRHVTVEEIVGGHTMTLDNPAAVAASVVRWLAAQDCGR